jgi:hypothetical protein
VFAPVQGNEPVDVTTSFFHVIKDAKPQARSALLLSASDELIKAIVECAINTLKDSHKLSKDEKSKLKRNKNCLRELVNPKISFKSKRKLLIQKGGFIFPVLTTILSGVIGTQISSKC